MLFVYVRLVGLEISVIGKVSTANQIPVSTAVHARRQTADIHAYAWRDGMVNIVMKVNLPIPNNIILCVQTPN